MSEHLSPSDHDAELAPLAPISIGLGLVMMVAALLSVVRIPSWAIDYGIMVIAAGVLYLTIAGGLVYWGVDRLRNHPGDN
ncbi:hypothetical protein AB0C34_05850 [Nocardia sp. NPDC049220]|uniref:hypothetical protein n=1 Tax=Nocardia sp. NPDC049220 TaxID=3155273 RepID=UPI0033CF631E